MSQTFMDKLLGGLGTGAAVGAGLLAINKAYDDLGDIGDQAKREADVIAATGREDAQFKPFTVGIGSSSATPSQFFSSETSIGQDGSLFTDLSAGEQLLKNKLLDDARKRAIVATDASGSQGLEAAGKNIIGTAGSMFANIPSGSRADREQDIFQRLRALQRPEEERDRLELEERLFGQGRLGVSTDAYGGTPEQLALAKAQEESKNAAALLAMQRADDERASQLKLASDSFGLGGRLLAGNLALQSAEQGMGLKALEAAYRPETQALTALRQGLLASQLAQRGQLYGTGLFSEASMGGLQALLKSGLGQADLMGVLGTGLLGGAMDPDANKEGSGTIMDILNSLF